MSPIHEQPRPPLATSTLRPGSAIAARAVGILSALLLLTAAALKWLELPIVHRTGQGLFHAPWFVFAQITLESALALWLLSGLLPLWSRRAAIAAFSLFTLVTAYKALTGADSCGCFGQLQVNPGFTLALDLTIVLALALTTKPEVTTEYTEYTEYTEKRKPIKHLPDCFRVFRVFRGRNSSVLSVSSAPSAVKTLRIDSGPESLRLNDSEICGNRPKSVDKTPRSPHWRLAFLIAGIAIALSLTFCRMPVFAASSAHPGITFASGLAILEPEKWPGQPLPILDYLDGDKSPLATGNWTLVIYNNDCDHCRQLIPSLLQQARVASSSPLPLSPRPPVSTSPPSSAWVLVALPPYAPPGQELVPATPGLLRLRLTNTQEWFAQTPIIIQLQAGRVTTVKQGNEVVLPKESS